MINDLKISHKTHAEEHLSVHQPEPKIVSNKEPESNKPRLESVTRNVNPQHAVYSADGVDRAQTVKVRLNASLDKTQNVSKDQANLDEANKVALENHFDPLVSSSAVSQGDHAAALRDIDRAVNRYFDDQITTVRQDKSQTPAAKRQLIREIEEERSDKLIATRQKFNEEYQKNYAEIARRSPQATPDSIERQAIGKWNDRINKEAEAAYVYLGKSKVIGPDLTAADIRRIVAHVEKVNGNIDLPLNNGNIPEMIVYESKKSGVPVWMIMGQVGKETTYGMVREGNYNHTCADGETFTDGSIGNAHNLFNITPGDNWKGKVLDVKVKGDDGKIYDKKFRVYDSFEDSIKDYIRTVTSPRYRGTTLQTFIQGDSQDKNVGGYAPPSNGNGGYLDDLLKIIHSYGEITKNVNENTIPVPA